YMRPDTPYETAQVMPLFEPRRGVGALEPNRRRHVGEKRAAAREQVHRSLPAIAVERVQDLDGHALGAAAGERGNDEADLETRRYSAPRCLTVIAVVSVIRRRETMSMTRAACASNVFARAVA